MTPSPLCTVGRTGNDLHYRGYDILDLAAACEFEEVAHLLVHGKLPNRAELAAYKTRLKALRGLPTNVKAALEWVPASAHPMDVMRTGVSVLGTVLPERGLDVGGQAAQGLEPGLVGGQLGPVGQLAVHQQVSDFFELAGGGEVEDVVAAVVQVVAGAADSAQRGVACRHARQGHRFLRLRARRRLLFCHGRLLAHRVRRQPRFCANSASSLAS